VPDFLSLTELGEIYGVTRNKMGQWLTALGLRTTKEKKPSKMAFERGLVQDFPSTQPMTYYWKWHGEKTCRILDEAGHARAAQEET
jgi:hypothetical protein